MSLTFTYVCLPMCTCVGVCIHTHVKTWVSGWCHVFLSFSPPYFRETGSFTEPRAQWLTGLASQPANSGDPPISLSFPRLTLGLYSFVAVPKFYVCDGDPVLHPHAYTANTLLTEVPALPNYPWSPRGRVQLDKGTSSSKLPILSERTHIVRYRESVQFLWMREMSWKNPANFTIFMRLEFHFLIAHNQ